MSFIYTLPRPYLPHGQARSQKFAMGGGCFGGLGAEPPAAGGQWGCGGRAPTARKFCIFFAKITSFYSYFD